MATDQRHETRPLEFADDRPLATALDDLQDLRLAGADRDYQPSTVGQLFHQGGGHLGRTRGYKDRVKRRLRPPSEGAVHDLDTDVFDPQMIENSFCLARQRRNALDRKYKLCELRQDGRLIA